MHITGDYNNYLLMSNILAPVTHAQPVDIVQNVFTAAMAGYQDRLDQAAFSTESAKALSNLYTGAADLAAKAGILTLGDYGSVFFDRIAAATDASVLTATARSGYSPDSGAALAQYDFLVTSLASAQENKGLELPSQGAAAVNQGVNTFNIAVNGENTLLSIEAAPGDTNYAVLEKISGAVNRADLGLTARVEGQRDAGTAFLVLAAGQTGTAGAFQVADLSGNAMSATGAGTVLNPAGNAVYTLNGAGYTSQFNDIFLDGGKVGVRLSGVGEASLNIRPDYEKTAKAVSSFINEINSFTKVLGDSSPYVKKNVLYSVSSVVFDHIRQLESYGVTIGGDDYLQTDMEVLGAMITEQFSQTQEIFAGPDGMAVKMGALTSRIASTQPVVLAKQAGSLARATSRDLGYNASGFVAQTLLQNLMQGSLVNFFA